MAAVSSRKKARIEKEAVQIPEDVSIEILKKLHVKSLLRFRCACKILYSIISNHEFCNKLHRKRSCVILCEGNKTFVRLESLLEKEKTPIRSPPLSLPWQTEPEPEHTSSSRVLGSCNGLVCVYYKSPQRRRSGVYLWNPSTRGFRKLPSCKRVGSCCGFGYDGSKDDYKFVWMARRGPERRIVFDVFSLKSKTWRICAHDPSLDITLSPMHIYRPRLRITGVLSNGAIHWIVRYKDHGIRILALDLASEKCRLLKSPQECGENIKVESLSGCPCLYISRRDVWMSSIHLWMMKVYGVDSSWIKVVAIPTTLSVPRAISLFMCTYHPIHFSSEEGNIVSMAARFHSQKCEIMRLQVKNGVVVSYETLLSVSNKDDVAIVLEESLVSP